MRAALAHIVVDNRPDGGAVIGYELAAPEVAASAEDGPGDFSEPGLWLLARWLEYLPFERSVECEAC
jgi:hypothetical protein